MSCVRAVCQALTAAWEAWAAMQSPLPFVFTQREVTILGTERATVTACVYFTQRKKLKLRLREPFIAHLIDSFGKKIKEELP